jgi:hypothetical protein
MQQQQQGDSAAGGSLCCHGCRAGWPLQAACPAQQQAPPPPQQAAQALRRVKPLPGVRVLAPGGALLRRGVPKRAAHWPAPHAGCGRRR